MLQSQKLKNLKLLVFFLLQITTSLNNGFEIRLLADQNDCKQNLTIPFNLQNRLAIIDFTRTNGNVTMYFTRGQDTSSPVCRLELSGSAQITIYSADNNQICKVKQDIAAGTPYGYEITLDSAMNAISSNLNKDVYCKDNSVDVSSVRFLTVVAEKEICGFDYRIFEQKPTPEGLILSKTAH
jgi:hypothetical protein